MHHLAESRVIATELLDTSIARLRTIPPAPRVPRLTIPPLKK
jgi:hypothetical protein